MKGKIKMLPKILSELKDIAITGKEKAFVAGLVGGIAAYLNQNGLTYHDLWSWHIAQALTIFLVIHQAVYWKANSQG